MTAAVSVVIPVYERATVLPGAVRSALAQTRDDIEVVIVDDGSPVDLATVVGDFGDDRVRWIRHQTNQGVSAARNTGIRGARAEYVAFLDSDDRWKADKLACQLAALKQTAGDAQACCTGFTLYRPGHEAAETSREENRENWFAHLMWGCNLSLGSTLLVERSCFETVGFFDERFRRFEDWDWLLRFVRQRRLILLPTPLCEVHVSGPARPTDVEAGLDLMREQHMAAARAHGVMTKRRFLSSLWLERSALAYRAGGYRRAITCLVRSYATYPLRNSTFYRRMLHHLSRAIFRSPSGGDVAD